VCESKAVVLGSSTVDRVSSETVVLASPTVDRVSDPGTLTGTDVSGTVSVLTAGFSV